MEENLIKVYVQVDSNNIITSINSGLFITDTTNWTQIDEGSGDKYAHAQSNYLDKDLIDSKGKYNYKLVDNKVIERTEDEKVNLDEIKQNKINEIEQWCKTTIINGFKSSAYQSIEKTYATTLEDQANITGNALSATSKIAGVPECINDKFYYHAIGEDFVEWTAGECLQLARDFKTFKETQLLKSKALQSYLNGLTTVDNINKVTSFDFVIPTK